MLRVDMMMLTDRMKAVTEEIRVNSKEIRCAFHMYLPFRWCESLGIGRTVIENQLPNQFGVSARLITSHEGMFSYKVGQCTCRRQELPLPERFE